MKKLAPIELASLKLASQKLAPQKLAPLFLIPLLCAAVFAQDLSVDEDDDILMEYVAPAVSESSGNSQTNTDTGARFVSPAAPAAADQSKIETAAPPDSVGHPQIAPIDPEPEPAAQGLPAPGLPIIPPLPAPAAQEPPPPADQKVYQQIDSAQVAEASLREKERTLARLIDTLIVNASLREKERAKTAKPRRAPSTLSSAFIFPAGYLSYNARDGYRKYKGIDEYEHISRKDLFIYGVTAGKRFALKNPRLRFQAAAEIGWCRGQEDEFDAESMQGNMIRVFEYINLNTFGVQADLHILFPSMSDISRTYFLSVGPGLHRTSVHNTWETRRGQEVFQPTNKVQAVSYSINLGAGIEYKLSKQQALSCSYNFRIWSPVSYNDFVTFPMGVKYHEDFFSHALQLQILWPKSWQRGF
jgi:hypothetical protein